MGRARLLRRSVLVMTSTSSVVAVVLGIVVLGALVFRSVDKPALVRIAVGPDPQDVAFAQALQSNMPRGFESSRIEIVHSDTFEATAAAVDQDRAGLAIVRSDVAVPKHAGAMLIVHRDAALFLAPTAAKLDDMSDLANKKVGILPGSKANGALLDTLLTHYGIEPGSVAHVPLGPDGLKPALGDKRIDLVMVVAPLASTRMADALAAVGGQGDQPARIMAPSNVDGLVLANPGLDKVQVDAGTFAGAPPKPDSDFATVDVGYLLVAQFSLSEAVVDQLTRSIFEMRRVLTASAPVARFMQGADTEKGGTFALHPGATSYYQDTEKTFMDRYGDWFYIFAMFAGGIGSAFASLVSTLQARSRRSAMVVIDHLAALRRKADGCADAASLRELDGMVSEIALQSLHSAREGRFDQAGLEILRLAIDETRRAIRERRADVRGRAAILQAPS